MGVLPPFTLDLVFLDSRLADCANVPDVAEVVVVVEVVADHEPKDIGLGLINPVCVKLFYFFLLVWNLESHVVRLEPVAERCALAQEAGHGHALGVVALQGGQQFLQLKRKNLRQVSE